MSEPTSQSEQSDGWLARQERLARQAATEARQAEVDDSSKPFTYVSLRLISSTLNFIGWMGIALGIIGVVLILVGLATQLDRPTLLVLLYASISAFIGGIVVFANGELIRAFVDIALNTAPLHEISKNIARLGILQGPEIREK